MRTVVAFAILAAVATAHVARIPTVTEAMAPRNTCTQVTCRKAGGACGLKTTTVKETCFKGAECLDRNSSTSEGICVEYNSRTAGQSCEGHIDCKGGLWCHDHVCQAQSAVGGSCAESSLHQCKDGLYCNKDVCQVPQGKGSACLFYPGECQEPLYCDANKKICVAGEVGDGCLTDSQCMGSNICNLNGFVCAQKEYAKDGQVCGHNSAKCESGLVCSSNNVCYKPFAKGDGAACADDNECNVGSECDDKVCKKYLYIGAAGSTCHHALECQQGLLCTRTQVCAVPPSTSLAGTDCNDNAACGLEGECHCNKWLGKEVCYQLATSSTKMFKAYKEAVEACAVDDDLKECISKSDWFNRFVHPWTYDCSPAAVVVPAVSAFLIAAFALF